jgi:hypothetical protein
MDVSGNIHVNLDAGYFSFYAGERNIMNHFVRRPFVFGRVNA